MQKLIRLTLDMVIVVTDDKQHYIEVPLPTISPQMLSRIMWEVSSGATRGTFPPGTWEVVGVKDDKRGTVWVCKN